MVDTDAPHPDLCVFFHGSRQSGTVARKFTNFTFDALSTRGCVVCYVDGVDKHFNDARIGLDESTRKLGVDDVAFFTLLLQHLRTTYDISRVFIVGYSNGGQMVMRLMHEVPQLLDGAATIAANFPTPDNTVPSVLAHTPHPVPYLAMAGTSDPFSPYDGGDSGISTSVRRGHGFSAHDSAAYFARRNHLKDAPTRTHYATDVVVDRWEGEAPVELWTLIGVGHLVPSGRDYPPFLGPTTEQLIAAEVIGDFFEQLPGGDPH